MKIFNNRGFSLVVVTILVIVVTVIVLLGYTLFEDIISNSQTGDSANNQEIIQSEPSQIQELIESSLNDLDAVNLDNDLDSTDLDNDINSVL